jgi:TPR repeat protein
LACFLRFEPIVSLRPIAGWLRCAPFLGALLWAAPALADPREDTERAEASLRNGDLITAMALLRKAADLGYAPAQARLADLLDKAEQDAEAVALYRKAAEQDEPAGQYGLSRMLAAGEGVARDPQQALVWLRKAAERNYLPALEALARAYRDGAFGLARDPQEAARLEGRARAIGEKEKR